MERRGALGRGKLKDGEALYIPRWTCGDLLCIYANNTSA